MTTREPAATPEPTRGPDPWARLVPILRCPVCGESMAETATGVACAAGHSFDRARRGYLSLLGARGRRFPGDSAEQVAARERVLGSGLFDGVADALAGAAIEALRVDGEPGPVVLDAGAGTGFYLHRVVGAVAGRGAEPLGIGTEISVAAARRLARTDPRVAALVADTWDGIPLAGASVDLAQVVFAPRNADEFARVVRPGGTLVVAVPGPGHLDPLRSEAGMLTPTADKGGRLDSDLAAGFDPGPVRRVDLHTSVPASVAVDLALMGPSGVHLDRAGLVSRMGSDDRPVRLHVEVRSYLRRLQQ